MVTLGYVADASHHVLIEEKVAVGELRNPIFPESVGYEEEWEWSVEVWNIGEVAGDFRVKLTGDRIDESGVFTVLPGVPMTVMGPTMVGPANFQVHLELIGWVLGDSYHHVVGTTLSESKAQAERHVTASSEVVVEVGESVDGVNFPDAEFRNPDYPSEVDPDEVWEGIIEVWNSGTRRGWFLMQLVYDENEMWFDPHEIQAGWYGLCLLRAEGPLEFTYNGYFAEFTEHDSLAVSVPQRTSPPGELRDLKFPKFGVGSTEPWEGSIEAWNVGMTTETFRVSMVGGISAISDEFQLASGEHTIVTFNHTGFTPNGFTAILQRMMDEEWVDDDSKSEVDGVGERIMAWWKVAGWSDGPPVVSEDDPGAKIFMDGELLETSSLEREPIQVDLGRVYDTLITVRGVIVWTWPTRWSIGNSRWLNYALRWHAPIA